MSRISNQNVDFAGSIAFRAGFSVLHACALAGTASGRPLIVPYRAALRRQAFLFGSTVLPPFALITAPCRNRCARGPAFLRIAEPVRRTLKWFVKAVTEED